MGWAAAQHDSVQSPLRPQMSEVDAASYQVTDYLGAWQPQPLITAKWKADFTVAADGSGTHRTLQAALDALPASGRRTYIRIKPGVYREQICIRAKAPFALYGEGDPAAVVIVQGHYANEAKPVGTPANLCSPNLKGDSYGTPGSTSVSLFSDDIQLAKLTFANDAMDQVRDGVGYPANVGESGGAQGVALMTLGDKIQLQNVRLIGHQDTFYASKGRVLVQDSLINGDVDFIFGNAQLVIDKSMIVSRAGRRKPGSGGHVLAPSTAQNERYGFLIINSRLMAEPGVPDRAISLGRAWDLGVAHFKWEAGVSPNGQALIRDSELGPHFAGWGRSTSRRDFNPEQNRFFEFRNQAVADLAREALRPTDGWAAAEGGTSGGAAAAPGDVYEVASRQELDVALGAGSRPKIIKIKARIDLSTDDAGRPLGFDDYRDPAFDFEAYLKAYDPKTWGKEKLTGPLEEARQRSSRKQAARVLLRIPSNTTLIGAGSDAGFINGGLVLDKVDNVIVRNLRFADAYDFFPAWDPKDNADGEWNSDYDNLLLRGATHVWVDHCSFEDGARPDQKERVALGRKMQHHDGLLDITHQANFITISWNHFSSHDKTTLVGGSDKHTTDEGKLKVSFHHNHWEQVKERTPRVRFGEVHLYNNLFSGSSDTAYAYAYSIGVGLQSKVFSERNVWETSADIATGKLTRLLKGAAFFDRGSLHNGKPADLLGALRAANPAAEISADVGWTPRLFGSMDEAQDVPARVRAGAGAGVLLQLSPSPAR